MNGVDRLCLIVVARSLRLETLLCRSPGICAPGLILSPEGRSEHNPALSPSWAQPEKPVIYQMDGRELTFGWDEAVRVRQPARGVNDNRLVLGECLNELEASFYT